MISGNYVPEFKGASHALPDGMHMNADYPFMLPRISRVTPSTVTIVGRNGVTETCKIHRRGGIESFTLKQSGTYERLFHRGPTEFIFRAFKDTNSQIAPFVDKGENGS